MNELQKAILPKARERFKQIGENLRRLRIEEYEEKISQQELAKRMRIITHEKITHSRISKLESGKDDLSQAELRAYKTFFPNATTDFILGYTDCLINNYNAISVSKAFGLSDTSLKTLANIKKDGLTNDVINDLLHGKNGQLFEQMLFNINKLIDLCYSDYYSAKNGDKLIEGARRYKKRTGKDLDNYYNDDFILKDLNDLSLEQKRLKENIILTHVKTKELFERILLNTIKRNF